MRRLNLVFALCAPLLLSVSALASDEPAQSKPIKPAAAKEEASAPASPSFISASAKEEAKAASKALRGGRESKAEKAERLKEEQAAEELAAKVAEKMAQIRKERAARPVVRTYAPPIRRPDSPDLKPKTTSHSANASTSSDAHVSAVHWGYEGENGPQSWGKLSPANAKCDVGERQSPIDIRDGIRVELDPLSFDYKASQFSVIDNGHTIQVNMGAGNYINVSGRSYGLVQFHFHRPSEERINGRGSEMVVHLVHRDGAGKLAVVAILIERGKAHPLIQSVWNNLPLEKNESVNALSNMDLSQLIPKGRDYYTFMGSLTTPPCTEGVLWLVMKETIEMSPEQIFIFSRLYPMNARPIQKPAGRLIKESN
jgi:carbonic anhydrase